MQLIRSVDPRAERSGVLRGWQSCALPKSRLTDAEIGQNCCPNATPADNILPKADIA
jgi:hypothetical protein